jgi:nitrite reductase/ring-hydroxylating ferredoxin subunit
LTGITTIVRRLLFGRREGYRARLRRRFTGGGAPAPRSGSDGAAEASSSSGVAAGGRSANKEPPKGVTPPEGFEVVLHRDGLAPGQVTEVIIAGTAVAVARVEGAFFAMSNTCPHAGGPIGDGTMKGFTVTCPYHGWSYDVRDGKCFVNAEVRLPTYEVAVVGDAVCVRL